MQLKVLEENEKYLDGKYVQVIKDAILFSDAGWFYPVINGIPRLMIESFLIYQSFFEKNLEDYLVRKTFLLNEYKPLLDFALSKNTRTRDSFSEEWQQFDFEKDKTWDTAEEGLLQRFFEETGETIKSLQNKIVLDAGCGNGKLNCVLGANGIENFAIDFSQGIAKAYTYNTSSKVHFLEGDINFPPFAAGFFDLIQCSGVLIHTRNTRESFNLLVPFLNDHGKLSIWVYHKRKNLLHRAFNKIRNVTSKWPLQLQVPLYKYTILPASYVIKKIKGNPQNKREMFIDILDWFTPQYRWEHSEEQVKSWYCEEGFSDIKITTRNIFGFNTSGIKE